MARINLLDTKTTNFRDLIGNGKIYRVPLFQRDYSWREENWEDLWQDILMLHKDPESSHYMGAIVLQNSANSDKEWTIIDGQQRFATLSILAIALIDKISALVTSGQEPAQNTERQDLLKRTYLADKDPRSLRYSSKLILNENNNDFYQSNLINLRRPRNIHSLPHSNQLLWKAFDYFSGKISEDIPEVVSSGESLATFLADTVAQRLLFIQINVEDELNAYTVFETLNARGLELSATDLLKNYLFSMFQGPDDLREAQRQWKKMITTVQLEKFPEFLRYYLSLTYTRIRRDRLFKQVRNSVKTAQQAFDLLEELENYSSLFVALGNANDEFWRDIPQNQEYIRELSLFRVKQVYPTLFAAYEKFSPDDFTRLLKLIAVVSFRYTIVSSLNPNDLEAIYNKLAIDIQKETIKTPRQVFEQLGALYVLDEKFRQDFSLLEISTKGQKRKLVRYILWKLETQLSGVKIMEDSFSIEHILPENPDNSWQANFTEKQADEMVYRLGNMTVMEPALNREIGNQSYVKKLEKYQQSQYSLTQGIQAEDWTPDAIANRQQSLGRLAVQVWRADFA
ncbi:DUF262 domain-containing HNH endonuclease family protein [Laspinema sp. D1]|uniref:DUF262 domain-containing HNH endonuclease family protein n=1 Tax=Laspinema palackyanum D2a TaxID=2953684 RepID=A0ABT2MXL1_9CYAN|nr:DUF262 domain-containing HNH endonuclease family protein [Laspinema sp. D2a]